MLIYEMGCNPDKYEYMDSDSNQSPDGREIMDVYTEQTDRRRNPLAKQWIVPEFPLYSRRVHKTDYLSAYGLFPTFSELAVASLRGVFNTCTHEMLPIKLGGRSFFIFRALELSQCMVGYPRGGNTSAAQFDVSKVEGDILQCERMSESAFCTERFKNAFETAGLVGAKFCIVWPPDRR